MIQLESFRLAMKFQDLIGICYVFQGESYPALQKLDNFVSVLTTKTVWHSLNTGSENNYMITTEDQTQLGQYLEKIFL